MIVQSAPEGNLNFVIEQIDHCRMSGQLAEMFGNDAFAIPASHDLLTFVVAHHDEGWAAVDALCEQSPATGLPHHLTQTPLPYLVKTSQASPDFNETHHPFCGLLSSMHTYGLFNGRYGLSDFIFIDKIAPENKQAVTEMLTAELQRQTRLKDQLLSMPGYAWVEDAELMNHYKLLQFFDTLSLYFHMTHAEARGEAKFQHVPDGKGTDHPLTITPVGEYVYTLTPFPFKDEVTASVQGRYLTAQPQGTDFKPIVHSTQKETQTYKIIPG